MKLKVKEQHRLSFGVVLSGIMALALIIAVVPATWAQKNSLPQPAAAAQGASIYEVHCAGCHEKDGRGIPRVVPPLKGDPVATGEDPTGLIEITLFGLEHKTIGGVEYTVQMPPHADALSDEQIAAVVNHVRTNWGNHAPTVTAAEVARIRARGKPRP